MIVPQILEKDNRFFEKKWLPLQIFYFLQEGGLMAVAGIIAEFNPFHTGHQRLIRQIRQRLGEDTPVVAAMSGNWAQRGECAIADKWRRARWAVLGGADLVLELPTPWAISSAEGFARGGMEVLAGTGVVDTLCFGSECGQAAPLAEAARRLDSPEFTQRLNVHLDARTPFAVSRQRAAADLLGADGARVLASPNDNLGVAYIRAGRALGWEGEVLAVPRAGAGHDDPRPAQGYASASILREWMRTGQGWNASFFLPTPWPEGLSPASMGQIERAVLYRLRSMDAGDFARLPDSGAAEGLPERLAAAARTACSLEEFYFTAKTKRYTHARIRRLTLWAFLNLEARDRPERVPYLRVLAFNRRGREILRRSGRTGGLPVLAKPAHARRLSPQARELMELEARCTDLYDLCFPELKQGGREWTQSPMYYSCVQE